MLCLANSGNFRVNDAMMGGGRPRTPSPSHPDGHDDVSEGIGEAGLSLGGRARMALSAVSDARAVLPGRG